MPMIKSNMESDRILDAGYWSKIPILAGMLDLNYRTWQCKLKFRNLKSKIYSAPISLEITIRCTSEVPSPMSKSF